jgi:hypothetical protein
MTISAVVGKEPRFFTPPKDEMRLLVRLPGYIYAVLLSRL